MRRAALTVAAAAALMASATACPLGPADGGPIAGAGVQVVWATSTPIAVGQHFTLTVHACPTEAVLLAVDASMPLHRHGMNYRPSITPLGAGLWRVDGLMFHMQGTWELQLLLGLDGQTQTLHQTIELS